MTVFLILFCTLFLSLLMVVAGMFEQESTKRGAERILREVDEDVRRWLDSYGLH